MSMNKTFGDRVRERRKELGLSQEELAKKVGSKQGTISKIERENAKSFITADLAAALGVTVSWLTRGVEPKYADVAEASRALAGAEDPEFFTIGPNGGPVGPGSEQFEFVQAYKVQAAAGAGNHVYTEQPNGTRAFSRQWLQEKGFRPKDLVMIEANGDSMAPYINDGDAILVDQSKRNIVNGQVYVFRIDHDLRVKRLYRNVNGTITVTSDNKSDPAYREEQLRPEDLDAVNILGMVVWRAG